MATRNYNEKDLLFYSEKEIPATSVELISTKYGYMIKWVGEEEVSGYAIYQGSDEIGWEILVTVGKNVNEYQIAIESEYREDPFFKVCSIIEGDFIAGEMNEEGLVDFLLTSDHDSARQDATNRIRTQTGDWRSHPNIGGDLELLEGEPNTRETGSKGEGMIRRTLTFDGRFNDEDISVRAVPTSIYNIEFFTLVDTDKKKPLIIKEIAEL